jgi:hypothetical protein
MEFTAEYSRGILAKACQELEIDDAGAVLLRHQTNGVYLLAPASVVAKVARPDYSVSHIQCVVGLVSWFTRLGFPTVSLAGARQPVVIDGSAVTFWRYLPQGRPVSAVDLGRPLRELHDLPDLPAGVLPPPELDAITAIKFSLDNETVLNEAEHRFLAQRSARLAEAAANLRFEGESRVLHGDPQHGNALRDGDRTVLSDWESVVLGPAEWDLVTIEIHCRRFGHLQEYEGFCAGYGRDVRHWSGFEVLRDIRELRMIATNARKSLAGSPGALEVKRRIAQLRDVGPEGLWSIL